MCIVYIQICRSLYSVLFVCVSFCPLFSVRNMNIFRCVHMYWHVCFSQLTSKSGTCGEGDCRLWPQLSEQKSHLFSPSYKRMCHQCMWRVKSSLADPPTPSLFEIPNPHTFHVEVMVWQFDPLSCWHLHDWCHTKCIKAAAANWLSLA